MASPTISPLCCMAGIRWQSPGQPWCCCTPGCRTSAGWMAGSRRGKRAAMSWRWSPARRSRARSFGRPLPGHPEYIADISQVRLGLADPNTVIACVRTWEEYTGLTSGYDYIHPRGRIPGSAWAGEPGFEGRQYRPGDPLGQTDRRCQEIASLWRKPGDHARQAHHFLLRHRLAGQRSVPVCLADGLEGYRCLRWRLAGVER